MIRGPNAGRPRTQYQRSVGEKSCAHGPEAHVVYDMAASGYRAQLRCRCGRIRVDSAWARDTCARAEDDGRVMLRVVEAHAAQRLSRMEDRTR